MAAMAWSSVLLGCVLLGGDASSAFMQSALLASSVRDGTEFCPRALGIAQVQRVYYSRHMIILVFTDEHTECSSQHSYEYELTTSGGSLVGISSD